MLVQIVVVCALRRYLYDLLGRSLLALLNSRKLLVSGSQKTIIGQPLLWLVCNLIVGFRVRVVLISDAVVLAAVILDVDIVWYLYRAYLKQWTVQVPGTLLSLLRHQHTCTGKLLLLAQPLRV